MSAFASSKITSILLATVAVFTTAFADPKPNAIIIIVDDLGYADMAFLPDAPEDVKSFGTPGFDELAATGTYFQNAYGTSPICSPSRAGLITGRYQQRWGNYWYGEGGLPSGERTLPEELHDNGYLTVKLGKTHLNGGAKEFPTEHGFDRFLGFMHHTWDYIRLSQKDVDAYKSREEFAGFGAQILGPLVKADTRGTKREDAERVSYENSFTTKIFTDEAVDFIHENKDGKPFYLHIAYNAVHQPTYVVEESWAEKTGARYVPWDRDAPQWGYPYWEPSTETNEVFHRRWGHMGEVDVEGRRCYLANLLALDHSITRILEALDETGQRENTVIFFVSDNGGTINTYANNSPLRGYKFMFGEGGIRVPMIVSMPGTLPEGYVNGQAIVSTMDIFPTVLALADLPVPANLDGKTLLPVLAGETDQQHEWLAWAKNRDSWVLRKGDWKLANDVGWQRGGFKQLPNGDVVRGEPVQYPSGLLLYNLKNDIGETTNLAEEYPDVTKELLQLQATWAGEMADPINSKNVK